MGHSNLQDLERVWLGGSWFGPINKGDNVNKGDNHTIIQVKTAHARYQNILREKDGIFFRWQLDNLRGAYIERESMFGSLAKYATRLLLFSLLPYDDHGI